MSRSLLATAEEKRTRTIGLPADNVGRPATAYSGNKIKTSKYTWYNFLPRNLYEQLHKFGNVYFLLVSVLMYLGEHTALFIGTIKAFSTFCTLIAMMGVSAAVALLDDHRRAAADLETNGQKAVCVNTGEMVKRNWEQVQVGDVLLVSDGQEFPADLVPLYCSGQEGTCYVSTANLDGETNLKLKSAPPASQKALAPPDVAPNAGEADRVRKEKCEAVVGKLRSLGGSVEAEVPQTSIHDFTGRLRLTGKAAADEPLEGQQLLLRGTVLRNTHFCVGIVVYTGPDTRMVMNSRKAPMKQSNLERVTNIVMLVVLLAQAVLALASDVLFLINRGTYRSYWYLFPPQLLLPDWASYWLTFFVLYSNMMPISLYPTAEWCNACQSYFIKHDLQMYYKDLEFPAGVRSSNLCQELGQVSYIFSDKTGTLTQNVMELKCVYIAGQVYGTVEKGEKGFNGGRDMGADCHKGRAAGINSFLEVLAVSHTVMASRTDDGQLRYEAESPDESALVEAVADLGWRFSGRAGKRTFVEFSPLPGVEVPKAEYEYTVHAVNAFDSTRKRMSVVVQRGEAYFLLVKGADNVMLQRSAESSQPELEGKLMDFSKDGLRTLVIGRRDLEPAEFHNWLRGYEEAHKTLQNRDGALARVAEEIEKGLVIVGATAIEDKLQAFVPETIEKIREAGIKLWVLTGDKLETARNIGFSARVLDDKMTIGVLEKLPDESQMKDALRRQGEELRKKASPEERALMVTGPALDVILGGEQMKGDFLRIATECSIVIACRVSPLQKAQMVRLVRQGVTPTPVTLAVGDGANDVPMIQEAQVGVGIAGREGRQAVNNSDFAIGQFSYLQRLLLVHGRWNYRRVCKFTLFTFWRNAVQVLMIFYYTFFSGYSGTSLFEDWIRLSFNFLCSFPIMATGCFDQDVTETVALDHPRLYEYGRMGVDMNPRKIGETLLSALTHSLILLGVMMAAFPGMDLLGAGDYYSFGTAVYSCLLLDMNYRVAFLNYTHNRYTLGSIAASFVCYVLYLIAYPCQRWVADMLAPNMYMVPYRLAATLPFWLCLLAVPVLAMNIDTVVCFIYGCLSPRNRELAELRHGAVNKPNAKSDNRRAPSLLPPEDAEEGHALMQIIPSEVPKGIDASAFAQQRHPGRYFDSSLAEVRLLSVLVGIVLFALGLWVIMDSEGRNQIRIHYEGDSTSVDPWGTRKNEIFKRQKACGGLARSGMGGSCTVNITVPEDMKPPILLYYAMGPFYQNYNDYLKSEVTKELMGHSVPDSLREHLCIKPTRVDQEMNDIVPCGMKAMSMFNDSFTIQGLKIHKKSTAWDTDIERYDNPPGYRHRARTTWLYETYPSIVSEEEGVKNEQFSVWMRPSALARIWNPYGVVHEELKAGRILNITIDSHYPVSGLEGYKHLVLTEVGPLGGRHNGLGYLLAVSGGICIVLGLAFCVAFWWQSGPRSAGNPA